MKSKLHLAATRPDVHATAEPADPAEQDNAGLPAPGELAPRGDNAHGAADDAVVLSEALTLLRESEARFRRLIALSAVWCWRQDKTLRFTPQDGGGYRQSGLFSNEDVGKTRWELPISGVSETQWQVHRETLAARLPFRDFEFQRKCLGGRTRHVSISGEPTFDPSGRFTGYQGIGRDITEKKRADQMSELEHAVARLLAGANETWVAVKAVIQAICDTENWDCARYWRLDETDGVFRAKESWSRANPAIDTYFAASRGKVFRPGAGLVGRVVESGLPLWVADLGHDKRVQDLSSAYAIGLRSACLFPVAVDGRITGVFAFMSGEIREPDDRLLAAVLTIGSQVGQFLERKQGEEVMRESEARYRALTDLSSDWYWEQDECQRFTGLTRRIDVQDGIPQDMFIGKTRREVPGLCWDEPALSALEALFTLRQPFRAFEIERTVRNGPKQYVSLSGEPMFDSSARFVGYRGIGSNITERKHRDLELQRFRLAVDATADAIYVTDRTSARFLDVNDAACRMLGYTREELLVLNPEDVFSTSQANGERAEQSMLAGATDVQEIEALHQRKNGSYLPVEVHRRAHRSGDDWTIVGVARDITGRLQAEHAIRTNSMQQGLIAKFGQQALSVTDINALLANAVGAVAQGLGADCCRLLHFGLAGHPMILEAGAGWDDGWLGRAFTEAGPRTQIGYLLERREPVIIEDFASESRFEPSEILVVHGIKSGLEVLIGGAGAPYGILGGYSRRPCTFSQESVNFLQSIANTLGTAIERSHAEEKLAYLAQYDSLTGLANRTLFRDRLAQSLTEAERNECMVGILYIDLDGFKGINDTHGHDAGDRLLTLVAERLQSCVRHSDTVGRLGGDEFAIVIANLADGDDADLVAEQIVEQLSQPFDLDGRETLITASIGISIYPIDGMNANLLLKNADTAMYQGKEQGRNNFQSYSVALDDAAASRRQLALELRHALEHEEFELHYQPQVSLDTGRVIGVEALLRWWHPVLGLLAAGEFIEVAEETGLIVPIGQWVFETACKQTAEWQRAGFSDLFVAVNVSPVEIQRGRVVEQVKRALDRSGLASRHLEIELTESVITADAESFTNTLIKLKDLGISIAIDDFGTGYSSLSSLKNFPIDKVKFDQTFTRDIVTDPDDSAIVQAVIAMSHHLHLEVVAKGVETEPQAGFLRRCRCDSAQGFLFGAPMQAAHLKELLDDSDGRVLPAARAVFA